MLRSNENYAELKPMYPLLIQQFVDDYDLMHGIALDIGAGPGWLGMELAKITNMKIVFLDISQGALDMAKENFEKLDVDNEVDYIQADVHELPMEDDRFDFIMSRGSIWFWKQPEKALKEIERILKPGGVAIVGGGLGRYLPPSMRARLQNRIRKGLKERMETRPNIEEFKKIVEKAGLINYKVLSEDEGGGRWVEIRK
ncbi:MAG TPA: class I SAM-dependent methyltransferase [Christensenellaceae bacterium]|nr:class I SAM-dependent methyltransferase [Christensenellaceae bacterium]